MFICLVYKQSHSICLIKLKILVPFCKENGYQNSLWFIFGVQLFKLLGEKKKKKRKEILCIKIIKYFPLKMASKF